MTTAVEKARWPALLRRLTRVGYTHPLCEGKPAWVLDDDIESAAETLGRLRRLCRASLATPSNWQQLSDHRYAGIGDRLDRLLDTLEQTESDGKLVDWARLQEDGAGLFEPTLTKLLLQLRMDLFKPDSTYGLGTLVGLLRKADLSPFDPGVHSADFTDTTGWPERGTLANCLRSVLRARLGRAHADPRVDLESASKIGWSALVVSLEITEHNASPLEQVLPPLRQPEHAVVHDPVTCFGGPPKHRRVLPEKLQIEITREDTRRELRNLVQQYAANRRGALVLVSGPPGWGKTEFIMGALAGCETVIRITDLDNLVTHQCIASALLKNIEIDDDAVDLDRNPLAAVTALARHYPHPVVVVLESCTSLGRAAALGLPAFLTRMVRNGLFVIAECWGHITGSVPTQVATLRRLGRDEVSLWGELVLRRPLAPGIEADALDLMDGYPTLIASALETLKARYPTAPTDSGEVERTMFDVMDTAILYVDEWRHFTQDELGTIVQRDGLLDDVIMGCFGLLPWTPIRESYLTSDRVASLNRLVCYHVVGRDEPGPSWRSGPVMRLLAHERLQEARVSEACRDLAVRIARDTPEEHVNRTRRHLALLVGRKWVSVDETKPLFEAIDGLSWPEEAPPDGYVAPLVTEEPVVAPDGLPTDLRLQLIVGAMRLGRFDEVAPYLDQLHELRPRGWLEVKALHQLLLAVEPGLRLERYREIIPNLIDSDWEIDSDRAWVARLLVFAAQFAFGRSVPDQGTEWLAAARQLAGELRPAPRDSFAERMNRDLEYRIARASVYEQRTMVDLAGAHWNSLSAIPGEWSSEPRWFYRWMGHVLELIRLSGWSEDWRILVEERLEATRDHELVALLLARLLTTDRSDADLRAAVRDLARPRELRARREGSELGAKQLALLSEPATAFVSTVKLVARLIEDSETEDRSTAVSELIPLLEVMYSVQRNLDKTGVGHKRSLRNLSETVIRLHHGDRADSNRALQSSCFIHIREHELSHPMDRVELAREEFVHGFNWRREIGRAIDVVDRLFAEGVQEKPWLWLNWTREKIYFSRIWNHCSRRSVRPGKGYYLQMAKAEESAVEAVSRMLREFVALVEQEATHDAAKAYARYRVARYLWDFEAAVVALEDLTRAGFHLDGQVVIQIRDLLEIVPLILTPKLLLTDYTLSGETQLRMRKLFLDLNRQVPRMACSDTRLLLDAVARILKKKDSPKTWMEMATYLRHRLGPPRKYWERVVETGLGDTDSTGLGDVDVLGGDLTDPQRLRIATWLCRYGACLETLDVKLRRRLSEAAVSMAMAVAAWNCSVDTSDRMLDRWGVGTALAIALPLSRNGTLFGRKKAPVVRQRSVTLKTWREVAFDGLSIPAFGRFGKHAKAVAHRLREHLKAPGNASTPSE